MWGIRFFPFMIEQFSYQAQENVNGTQFIEFNLFLACFLATVQKRDMKFFPFLDKNWHQTTLTQLSHSGNQFLLINTPSQLQVGSPLWLYRTHPPGARSDASAFAE